MRGLLLMLVLAGVTAGCVSKHAARRQAAAAYQAGANRALAAQRDADRVTFQGPVQQPEIPWQPGLTLSEAIVAAVYQSPLDPRWIVIFRGGQPNVVDPRDLLHGRDYLLEPGDVVEFR